MAFPLPRFPESEPNNCNRRCKRIYMAHTRTLSFALYATENSLLEPDTICCYAFSCGQDVESLKIRKHPNETPSTLVKRIVPELLVLFTDMAKIEIEDGEKVN